MESAVSPPMICHEALRILLHCLRPGMVFTPLDTFPSNKSVAQFTVFVNLGDTPTEDMDELTRLIFPEMQKLALAIEQSELQECCKIPLPPKDGACREESSGLLLNLVPFFDVGSGTFKERFDIAMV